MRSLLPAVLLLSSCGQTLLVIGGTMNDAGVAAGGAGGGASGGGASGGGVAGGTVNAGGRAGGTASSGGSAAGGMASGGGLAGGASGGGGASAGGTSGGLTSGGSAAGGSSGGSSAGGSSGGSSAGGSSGGSSAGGSSGGSSAGGSAGGSSAGGSSALGTEFVVLVVGDGSGSLSAAAAPVFLQRRSIATGALLGTLPLPTAAAGANQPLTLSGTSIAEGALSRSVDRRRLALTGYTSAPGTASVGTTTTPRVVGLVTASSFTSMTVDTSTTLGTAFSANSPRSAVVDGTNVWVCGSSDGVLLTSPGATTTPTAVVTNPTNSRALGIFGGQLWLSTGAGQTGVHRVGLTATLPLTPTNVYVGAEPPSPYGFAIFENDSFVSGLDLIYVADDVGGLQRGLKFGSTWQADDYWTPAMRHLSCVEDGNDVVCLGTNSTDIFFMRDRNKFSFGRSLPSLATAAPNTAFRGIAFMPIP
jgi:hypothetical protein